MERLYSEIRRQRWVIIKRRRKDRAILDLTVAVSSSVWLQFWHTDSHGCGGWVYPIQYNFWWVQEVIAIFHLSLSLSSDRGLLLQSLGCNSTLMKLRGIGGAWMIGYMKRQRKRRRKRWALFAPWKVIYNANVLFIGWEEEQGVDKVRIFLLYSHPFRHGSGLFFSRHGRRTRIAPTPKIRHSFTNTKLHLIQSFPASPWIIRSRVVLFAWSSIWNYISILDRYLCLKVKKFSSLPTISVMFLCERELVKCWYWNKMIELPYIFFFPLRPPWSSPPHLVVYKQQEHRLSERVC